MNTLFDALDAHRKNKKDHKVFGLVLQGGGMRGVYSSAATVPLLAYGFGNSFEHVIGSSAGAINGAYFLSQDEHAIDTYTDNLTHKDFVNLLRRDKKVDVDFLINVLQQTRPLRIQKLLKSEGQLHVVVTDAKTGKKVVISDHRKFAAIYEELRATAALPLLYDKPVLVDNKYYIDGAVADLLPVDVAIKLGCTDIVVVLTRQLKDFQFDQRHTRLINHLIKKFAKDQPEAVRKILPTDEKLLQINIRRLLKPHRKIRLYVLEPSNDESLFALYTIDKDKVKTLAKLGIADMDAFLQRPLDN